MDGYVHASPGFIHQRDNDSIQRSPSVLPQRGGFQVVSVGLQHTSMVSAEVLAVGGVADGQLVVVAKLEEEVDRCVTATHHRLLITHHPVFAC